jgi:zinc protease
MKHETPSNGVLKTTLPNGLTVILKEDHSNPVVAINVWFGIGSAHETDAATGLSHFQEHMVFKGTEKYGVGEIPDAVKSAGGSLNAGTSYSYTMYHVVMPSRSFALGLEVQADAMMNSTFDPDEFRKERLVVIDEARMYDDTPDAFTYYRAMELGFTVHNYRRPIAGYEPVVSSFTREQLVDSTARTTVPETRYSSSSATSRESLRCGRSSAFMARGAGSAACPSTRPPSRRRRRSASRPIGDRSTTRI